MLFLMIKVRRLVTLNRSSKGKFSGGGKEKLFAYGYTDIARILGLSLSRVRQLISTGLLDPSDLNSILIHAMARHKSIENSRT